LPWRTGSLSPERLARIERRAAELREEEITLRELRKGSDVLLSTLRSYIRAMGGELELVARLPNRKSVRLREIGELEP
jgi:hypothetical protein